MAKAAYDRELAIITYKNCDDVDLFIPFKYTISGKVYYSSWLIQVKNYASKWTVSTLSELFENLHHEYCPFAPKSDYSIATVMTVGSGGADCVEGQQQLQLT